MSYFLNISAALDQHLDIYATGALIDVAWENYKYKQKGSKYLKVNNLPANSIQRAISSNGYIRHSGTYQVMVMIPIDSGKGEGISIADSIATHFSSNLNLTYNGTKVKIKNVSIGAGIVDEAYFMYPLSISYESFTGGR